MPPGANNKPPKQVTSYSNVTSDASDTKDDQDKEESNCKSLSTWTSPGRTRRSTTAAAPEYLIRTGSMKSKDIKHENLAKDRDCTTMPGSYYASYLLQAGCFLWKGR